MPRSQIWWGLLVIGGLALFLGGGLAQHSQAQVNSFQLRHSGQDLGISRTDDVFLGDIDGDRDLDLLTQDDNYAPSQIWLNDGSGVMRDGGRIGEQYEMLPLFGDVDGDGDLDAVSRVVRLNDGRGTFTLASTNDADFWPLTSERRYRKLGDVDGDGDLDYVSTLAIWTNNGAGVFTRGMMLNALYYQLELGDMDRDGDLDIVGLDQRGLNIWRNNGQGTFSAEPAQPFGGASPSTFALGDLDGDGDLDVVIGGLRVGVNAYLNNGRGVFNGLPQRVEPGSLAAAIVLGDLDGDRDLDVFLARGPERDAAVRNNGGSFSLAWTSPLSDNSFAAALGDLNGDGQLDVATGNMGSLMGNENGAPDRIYLNDTPRAAPNRPRIIANTSPRRSGSTLAAQAVLLPPNVPVSVSVNGSPVLNQSLSTDAGGSLALLITTTNAADGFYTIALQATGEAEPVRISFVLRASAPLVVERSEGAASIALPANSSLPYSETFLPLVRR